MVTFLAAALLVQNRQGYIITLNRADGGPSYSQVHVYMDRLTKPKLSPKKFGEPPAPWEFDFNAAAFGEDVPGRGAIRFSIYSQERKRKNDIAGRVGQFFLRLWQHNFQDFKIDHNPDVKGGVIDVYLCFGGKAGGEQTMAADDYSGVVRPVNTIYIYDTNSFTDPVEMARELAHEYGHASLPPIGGFTEPEDWGNGYLGEKLFLWWARDAMAKGRLAPEDVMGATQEGLSKWVAKNVDPLVVRGALYGPEKLKGKPTMDDYLAFVLSMNAFLPPNVVGRGLKLAGSTNPNDVPDGFVLAVQEAADFTFSVPKPLQGTSLWLPIEDRPVQGAKVLRKVGPWRKLMPLADKIKVGEKQARRTTRKSKVAR